MNIPFRISPPLISALAFLVVIIAATGLVHFFGGRPTVEEVERQNCHKKCAEVQRNARLVPLIQNRPASSSAPYRGPWKCECY